MKNRIKFFALLIIVAMAAGCKIQDAPGAYARAQSAVPRDKQLRQPADTVDVVPVPKPVVRVMEGEEFATAEPEAAEEPSTHVVPDKRIAETRPEPEAVVRDEPQRPDTTRQPEAESAPVPAESRAEQEAEKPVVPSTAEREITRSEKFTLVPGQGNVVLKNYHVVVGSFGKEANAQNLQKQLQPDYHPIVVVNERGMYRVLLESYDTYAEAKAKIAEIADMFPDAWCLVQKN